jgi:hypothetical protein
MTPEHKRRLSKAAGDTCGCSDVAILINPRDVPVIPGLADYRMPAPLMGGAAPAREAAYVSVATECEGGIGVS